jgi:hypothetical protein
MRIGKACVASLMLAALAVGVVQTAGAQECPATVDIDRELMIRDVSVVEDPARTTGSGVWTFKHVMESMAPSAAAAPGFVEAMFETWRTDQTINGFVVPARPNVASLVLDSWPREGDALDLSQAPLRLLAIVNRIDLRNVDNGQAGEGRFVFGVLDGAGRSTQFTLILEYRLPAASEADVLEWANLWHGLSGLTLGSAEYNAALEVITERFAGRDADPGRINGSALNQLRTNELALPRGLDWELREFTLAGDGSLQPATVKQTPDISFAGSELTAKFVNDNESAILVERHTVSESFDGVAFLAGSAITPFGFFWPGEGISNNEARHKLSLNTCNGCHAGETNTTFLHVAPREPGEAAALSSFLTGAGGAVTDPVDPSVSRSFNDLGRRKADLEDNVLCPSQGIVERGTDSSLSVGILRVH